MCDKCQRLDDKITRYQRLASTGLDPVTIERIDRLIQELRQLKDAVMHDA
jgi:hypothetical protein